MHFLVTRRDGVLSLDTSLDLRILRLAVSHLLQCCGLHQAVFQTHMLPVAANSANFNHTNLSFNTTSSSCCSRAGGI